MTEKDKPTFDLTGFVLDALPLLAPVPTGWAVYAGVRAVPAFPMPVPVAVIGALSIIAVSIATTDVMMKATKFNKGLKNKDERALGIPAWWSWGVIALAIISEIILTLVIVVFPSTLEFSVLVFPIVTLSGALTFAIRRSLKERKQELDELRQGKQAKKQAGTQQNDSLRKDDKQSDKRLRKDDKQAIEVAQLLAQWEQDPAASDSKVAQAFSVSRQAIAQRRKQLAQEGVILCRKEGNHKVVEILTYPVEMLQ